jgi:tRNA threonylcarbamoyladenosine modification (KEOPS) complex Cgi121 subunit
MIALRCQSRLPLHAIVESAEAHLSPALLLCPRAIEGKTRMELEFAFCLASRAFEGKSNISAKISNEALLYLSREMNFCSALKRIGADDARDFVFVCEKNVPLSRVKKALGLISAKKIPLSKMGLKMGACFEGELAVEEMALSRVRN